MKKNKGKMGRPPPKWLFDLNNKVYTTEELVKLSEKTKSNVRFLMQKYCAEINYKVNNNKFMAYYSWNKEDFLQKISQNKN
jgi:hypothetical protein